MIGHLAYMAALNAPDIAMAAAEAGGYMAQTAGRNFAKGLADELTAQLSAGVNPLASSFLSAIGGGSTMASSIQNAVENGLQTALKGANAALVNVQELELLRELATAAATHGDVPAVVTKLKMFHAAQKP